MRTSLSVVLGMLLVSSPCDGQAVRQAGRVFAGAINEAQFANIWGKGLVQDAGLLRGATAATKRAMRSRGLTVLTTAPALGTMADEVFIRMRNATEGVFVLIGHNDNGRVRFGDGSWLALKGIGFQTGGAKLAIIGCETEQFVRGTGAGIPSKLAIDVAVATDAVLSRRLSLLQEDPSVEQLQSMLLDAFHEAVSIKRVGRIVKVSTPFGVGGAGFIVVYEVGT